jgi:hypothetical protein
MRIRATVAAVCGALALSALVVPASQASQSHNDRPAIGNWVSPALKGHAQAGKRTALAASAPVITKTVVNNGAPIVVGTTTPKKVTIAITASDDSGIVNASTILWIGKTIDDPNSFGFYQNESAATCKAASATTSTCTLSVTVDPAWLINSDSTSWHVGAFALAKDGEYLQNDTFTTTHLQRLSQVTVNAAPEPVKKGGTLTVTGKLSRANWETHTYKGYAGQTVTLQFRKKTSTTYTNLKTLKTSSVGTMSTTTKSTVDGAYRWNFAGTSTTPAVIAAGDGIDVK